MGDIIEVGEVSGYVEFLNSVVTQLRSSGGELVTLNNGEITIVKNLTKEWSRMDLTVDVEMGRPQQTILIDNTVANTSTPAHTE